MLIDGYARYIGDPWNKWDQAMYIILLLAVIVRCSLTNDNDFMWARYVYAINLVMFYLRILEFYYVHKRLGSKVVVIWRMVCATNDENVRREGMSSRLNFTPENLWDMLHRKTKSTKMILREKVKKALHNSKLAYRLTTGLKYYFTSGCRPGRKEGNV